eukprot:Rhum_TRINITY_DN9561_c0_g1::Rhum_TRINITY_DN9561_c0_g1_i1::g.34083::m.34083
MRPSRRDPLAVKVFTADNVASALSAGWSPEQLTSGRVAVLGARTHKVSCAHGATVKALKHAVTDLLGYAHESFSLMQGTRTTTEACPVVSGATYLVLRSVGERDAGAAAARPAPGTLLMKDPRCHRGSVTVTETEDDGGSRDTPAPSQQAQAQARSLGAGARDVNRRDVLRALAQRHGSQGRSSRPYT